MIVVTHEVRFARESPTGSCSWTKASSLSKARRAKSSNVRGNGELSSSFVWSNRRE